MTLITAKINVTTIINSRQDLISEVFAPWRTRSAPYDIPACSAILPGFKAAESLPSGTDDTQFSEGSFVSGSEAKFLGDMDDIQDKLDSPC